MLTGFASKMTSVSALVFMILFQFKWLWCYAVMLRSSVLPSLIVVISNSMNWLHHIIFYQTMFLVTTYHSNGLTYHRISRPVVWLGPGPPPKKKKSMPFCQKSGDGLGPPIYANNAVMLQSSIVLNSSCHHSNVVTLQSLIDLQKGGGHQTMLWCYMGQLKSIFLVTTVMLWHYKVWLCSKGGGDTKRCCDVT